MSKRNTCGSQAGLVILASLALLSAAGSGQDRQPEQAVSAQQNPAAKPGGPDRLPPDFHLKGKVPEVTIDVNVLTTEGAFVPGLKKENFKVLEDGVSQKIHRFSQTPLRMEDDIPTVSGANDAPPSIAAAVLSEFPAGADFYDFSRQTLIQSFSFAQNLKKEDSIALVTYDKRSHILQDFTRDKRAVMGALSAIQPGLAASQEANLLDALYETVERLEAVAGRKYVILVSSGRDTSSQRSVDQVLKTLESNTAVAVYVIDTGSALRAHLEKNGRASALCGIADSNCSASQAKAEEQMKHFARVTGGRFYAPRSESDLTNLFIAIAQDIRNQYVISYNLTNRAQDGSFRKIKIELVDGTGKPLQLRDQQGRSIPYHVVSREGYRAVQPAQ